MSFEQTDVSIPGNFNIPVSITRILSDPDGWHRGTREFGNWSLSIPHISSTYITNKDGDYKTAYWPNGKACRSKLNSNPRFSTKVGSFGTILWPYSADGDNYWSGDSLSIPGLGTVKFTEKSGDSTHKRYNKNNWPVSCYDTPAGHEGFIVTTDNGTTYTFSQRKDVESIKPYNLVPATSTVPCQNGSSTNPCSPETVSIPGDAPPKAQYRMFHTFMLISEVKDIHENWVRYEYHTNGNLKRIISKDGREIKISYNSSGYIEQVAANGKLWSYEYDFYSLPTLKRIVLPDNSYWSFSHNKNHTSSPGMWHRIYHLLSAQAPVGRVGCIETEPLEYISIKHPQGAKGSFTMQRICHGTSNVPKIRKFNSQRRNYETYWIEPEKQLHSIVGKSLDINGNSPYFWRYQYSSKKGVFRGDTPGSNSKFISDISGVNTADYNRTTVIYPDNSKKMMYFDRRHGYGYGNMIHEVSYSPTGTKIQQVTHSYEDGYDHGSTLEELHLDATQDRFAVIDLYEGWGATKQQRKTSVITQLFESGGLSSYASYFSDFNQFDRHRITKQQSSEGTRYFKVDFLHDTAQGLLNLPTRSYVSSSLDFGFPYKEIVYKSGTNLPYLEKAFGQTLRSYEYNVDGTLKKTSYNGSNRYEKFENYYRGKARKITLPCATTNGCTTVNGSTANTMVALLEVNADGTTKSVTDFNGNKASYSYNPIGWLTKIDYADPKWADKVISYATVTTANDGISGSGIAAGSLRQSISQGNYEKRVYHDALLRPVFTRERDIANGATTRYQAFEYDHENRQTLASFPSSNAASRVGMATEYDVLGRIVTQTRTSDNSSSSRDYLAGNKVAVTDSEVNTITTTYLAYGQPTYDKPLLIEAPNTDDISLDYNEFAQVTSIRQGNITEKRLYDNYQQLCKSVRPETGITAYGYNAQRQQIWRALGTNGSSTSCDAASVPASHKTLLGYDNLGQLRTENFPDTTPDRTYNYDANGNLRALTAGNISWSYLYNSQNAIDKETLSLDGKSFVLDWEYNNLGAVSSLKYPSGALVDFAPNALGQATKAGSYVTGVSYHPNGQVKQFTFGNGIVRNVEMDTSGRIDLLTDSKSGVIKNKLDPSYDGNDNLVRLIDWVDRNNDIDNLVYDGVDRLLSADGRWGTGRYTYDGKGNILSRTLNNVNIGYSYNNLNQLSKLSGAYAYGYQYDTRGNVIHNGRYPLSYNLGQQMVS
ncbi:RHS repeat protein, partial [Shewanella sp. SE1]|nr:RHS repeat protein [Shewanella sp. SE1]